MNTSENGLHLIKVFEGLGLRPYICPAGLLTIGYGHVMGPLEKIKYKNGITEAQANELLRKDLVRFEKAINLVPHLTQNEFDALVAFVFNIGIEAFNTSTIRRLLMAGLKQKASLEFGRWVHAKGKVLPGLVRRRRAERDLFLLR